MAAIRGEACDSDPKLRANAAWTAGASRSAMDRGAFAGGMIEVPVEVLAYVAKLLYEEAVRLD
jgi:hypothetical protein